MARVKRGVEANRRHKKVLKQAKGYYGARSSCLLYTSPSPRDATLSRMPSSA